MIRRFVALSSLLAAFSAFAGQLCTLDPARPAGATGTGFYVVGGKLYDPSGTEFRIRGVNSAHPDASGTPAGIGRSGANTARMFFNFTKPAATNWATMQAVQGVVPIPTNWSTTCVVDPAILSTAVDAWVAQSSTWTQLNGLALVNIANEWGPSVANNSTGWRDGYLTAIARMRAAGYTMPLVIDAGYCGQDAATIVKYGQSLLDTDPQHNLLFSVHIYGSFHRPATATWMQDYATALSQLKATGLPIIVGEFGPGRNIAPSPTDIPPGDIVADAESNDWGWMAWSWDANDMPNCMSSDNSMSMTVKCGNYTGLDSELTLYGQQVMALFRANVPRAASFHP